jgi:peptidase M56, blaR1
VNTVLHESGNRCRDGADLTKMGGILVKKILSVVILTILFLAFLFTAVTLGMRSDDYIVLIKEDGLYAEHCSFSKNREVRIAAGDSFERPEVSPSGKYTAVVENGVLAIYHMEKRQLVYQYDKSLNYYNWDPKKDILYTSCQDGTLVSLDFEKKMVAVRTITGGDNTIYSNIIPTGETLYYNKSLLMDGENTPGGIWSFHMQTNQEKLLIPAQKRGMYPILSGVSKKGEYLFLFQCGSQGGQNTDGVEMQVYDVENQRIKQYEKPLVTLPYNQNLALNSEDNLIAINSGENRHMNFHKTVGTFLIEDGTFRPLIPENMVSMTPDISGQKVIFSAGKVQEDWKEFGKNGALQIYQASVNKRELKQLTNHTDSIQLNPVYLDKRRKIAYIRAYEDRWELWVMNGSGNQQRLAARNLKKLDSFYGSYYFYEIMDIHR